MKPDADERDADERWRIVDRQYFQKSPATVTCAAFHSQSNLLVTGFSIGIFTIHELPEFTEIQTLRWVAPVVGSTNGLASLKQMCRR
jgi:periodic tryptophan protein 2